MLSFISENIGTIVVGLVILGIVAAIVAKIVNDKRKAKVPAAIAVVETAQALPPPAIRNRQMITKE